jgi:hypothetical protein
MNDKKEQAKLDKQIENVKMKLMELGPMRPGKLSQQFRKPAEKAVPFWQLNYTYQMKSRSEYVRTESLPRIRKETTAFKKSKELFEKWIDLELQRSLSLTEAEKSGKLSN